MYFVTEYPAPTVFSMNGQTLTVKAVDGRSQVFLVPAGVCVYEGTPEQCSDFVFSCAGWVGAVDPSPRPGKECSKQAKETTETGRCEMTKDDTEGSGR